MITTLQGSNIEIVDTNDRFRNAVANLLCDCLSYGAYHSSRKVSVVATFREHPWFAGMLTVCTLTQKNPERRMASYVLYGTGEREMCDDEEAIKSHPTWRSTVALGVDLRYVKSLAEPDDLLGVLEDILTAAR